MRNLPLAESEIAAIRQEVEAREGQHLALLSKGLKASFSDLAGFQSWIGEQMSRVGMDVQSFRVDRAELADQLGYQKTLCEDPSALQTGPNVVGRLAGKVPGRGVLLFGHADKVPATFEWGRERPDMVEADGRLYGPGIADDVSGITAMLSAVETFRRLGGEQKGDLLVASVLGKQMGVFGTFGLMRRYGPVEGAIYVHPAESGAGLGELKIASLGLLEFLIEIKGKGPDTTDHHHTIFSRSAVSAVEKALSILPGLHRWAATASKRYRHAGLEALAGQAFAVSVGRLNAGFENEVYHIPLRCVLQGAVCFPPNARLADVQHEFRQAFESLVAQDPWLAQSNARLEWGDHVGESCQSDEESDFLHMASQAAKVVTGKSPSYYYGHSLSDIRYPILYWDAQAFGIGPLAGDLGKETEWVDRKEYLDTIVAVTAMLRQAA